jgi:hypothetical protein
MKPEETIFFVGASIAINFIPRLLFLRLLQASETFQARGSRVEFNKYLARLC